MRSPSSALTLKPPLLKYAAIASLYCTYAEDESLMELALGSVEVETSVTPSPTATGNSYFELPQPASTGSTPVIVPPPDAVFTMLTVLATPSTGFVLYAVCRYSTRPLFFTAAIPSMLCPFKSMVTPNAAVSYPHSPATRSFCSLMVDPAGAALKASFA